MNIKQMNAHKGFTNYGSPHNRPPLVLLIRIDLMSVSIIRFHNFVVTISWPIISNFYILLSMHCRRMHCMPSLIYRCDCLFFLQLSPSSDQSWSGTAFQPGSYMVPISPFEIDGWSRECFYFLFFHKQLSNE